jgi:hypothetical protein
MKDVTGQKFERARKPRGELFSSLRLRQRLKRHVPNMFRVLVQSGSQLTSQPISLRVARNQELCAKLSDLFV